MEIIKPEQVKKYFDDMVKDLATLVSFPSVYAQDEGTVFGKANRDCLHAALKMAESYGFKAVNLDDYCGYIEMGQGEEIIGILAHLDVVPVSDTWKTNPFQLTFIDGKYYGRGTSDDKGAVVCSLTALRMLKELEPSFTKRVRLILGCNEESGSNGVKYYVQKEGYVDCGFTPDGSFPLTFGEKGMAFGLLTLDTEKIESIQGGIVSNAVAAEATVVLKQGVTIDEKALADFFQENQIEYQLDGRKLTVKGAAAHASTPQLGKNAISYAMMGLYQANIQDPAVDYYQQMIGTTYHGEKLGIDFKDEYGQLTLCNGMVSHQDGQLIFTIDIRFPVTFSSQDIVVPLTKATKGFLREVRTVEPLFFAPEHKMIRALMQAYQQVSGDYESKPTVMGGGTYAKEMKGIVAFGCDDNRYDYKIHDDNEFVTEQSMLMQTACYYQAILNLMDI